MREQPAEQVPALQDSQQLEAEVRRLKQLAVFLDQAIRLPGTRIRIGADAIIGLIPVAGDLLSAALSTWLIARAVRLGVPRKLVMRMLGNMGIDAALGAVPVLGDIFDIGWRANTRNLDLLMGYLQQQMQHLQQPDKQAQQSWLRPALLLLGATLVATGIAGLVLLLKLQGTVQ